MDTNQKKLKTEEYFDMKLALRLSNMTDKEIIRFAYSKINLTPLEAALLDVIENTKNNA